MLTSRNLFVYTGLSSIAGFFVQSPEQFILVLCGGHESENFYVIYDVFC